MYVHYFHNYLLFVSFSLLHIIRDRHVTAIRSGLKAKLFN